MLKSRQIRKDRKVGSIAFRLLPAIARLLQQKRMRMYYVTKNRSINFVAVTFCCIPDVQDLVGSSTSYNSVHRTSTIRGGGLWAHVPPIWYWWTHHLVIVFISLTEIMHFWWHNNGQLPLLIKGCAPIYCNYITKAREEWL